MSNDDLRERVAAAAAGAGTWHEVGSTLRKDIGAANDDDAWYFVWAFEYMLLEPDDETGRERWGSSFAPWIEMSGTVFPPPLLEVSDDVLTRWQDLARTGDPIVDSRLNDLLWERKWGDRPDLSARAAIDAYRSLAELEAWNELDRANCLIRALDLSRQVGDASGLQETVRLIVGAIRTWLGNIEPIPGVTLRLLEALMRLPHAAQPVEIDDLLTLAASTYTPDAFVYQAVLDLQVARAAGDRGLQETLWAAQVQRWREEAAKRNDFTRQSFLQRAIEIARVHGFSELAEELRREMQEPIEAGLKAIRSSTTIPTEQIEAFIEAFLKDKITWKSFLESFGYRFGSPPSGLHEKNLQEVQEQMHRTPIQFLIRRVLLDENNFPIREAASEEEHREMALLRQELLGCRLWANFAIEIIDRCVQRLGQPSREELVDCFTGPLIPRDLADRVASALLLYLRGDHDESAHVVAPRIEAIIREMCRQLDLAIMQEPQQNRPGGVKPLGKLLEMLVNRIDESWRRYLRCLLSEPGGINLRNRIGHGLVTLVGQEEAVLLIHACCYLRLMQVGPPSPPAA